MVSANLLRVLREGPQGSEDYEFAAWLIEHGYARGVCGKRSKGRENYGKILQLVWHGPTPDGLLFLESSTGAEFDEAGKLKNQEANNGADQLHQEPLKPIVEAIAGMPKPPSNLVAIALGVIVMILGGMALLLLRNHLGISL